MPFGEHSKAAERRFKIGETVDFTFDLGDDKTISARGEIVWRRDRPTIGLPAGVGVKFTAIAAADLLLIEEYVRLHKIVSYIPLGPRESLGQPLGSAQMPAVSWSFGEGKGEGGADRKEC